MTATRIVEPLDEGEHRASRFSLCREATAREKLAFKRGEEALAHGVVVGISNRTDRRTHTRVSAAVTERGRCVLLLDFKWLSQHPEESVSMTRRTRRSDRSGRAPLPSVLLFAALGGIAIAVVRGLAGEQLRATTRLPFGACLAGALWWSGCLWIEHDRFC